jgi:hypothetical protein
MCGFVKLSIHPMITGKPIRIDREGKSSLYQCNGSIVNLGYGWTNVEVDSWKDAFELITTDGYATSAELIDDHRTDDNYVSRQICMVDIDGGMTIQELFNNDFYNEFGAGFYTTARHTDEAHRFRIMFVLEEPIYDYLTMRKIIRGLLEFYQTADTNCKDASRIYYGIKDCPIKEYRDKILYKYITDELVAMIDRFDQSTPTNRYEKQEYEKHEYDEEFVGELLTRIANKVGTLKGDYDVFKTIAWAVCHTLGQYSAMRLMSYHWPTKTKKEQQVIKDWNSNKSPTIGTLIKMSGVNSTELKLLVVQLKLRKYNGNN